MNRTGITFLGKEGFAFVVILCSFVGKITKYQMYQVVKCLGIIRINDIWTAFFCLSTLAVS